MLIDEPSLGLAPVAIDTVYEAIAELKASSTTILLVEENFTHVGGIADTVHVARDGHHRPQRLRSMSSPATPTIVADLPREPVAMSATDVVGIAGDHLHPRFHLRPGRHRHDA